MPGKNHEQIGGRDTLPLIAVEGEDPGPFYFVVRFWREGDIGRLRFRTREDAQQAEEAFRTMIAGLIPREGRTTVDEAEEWFDRMNDWEAAT